MKSKPALKVEEIKAGTRVVITATQAKDKSFTAKTIEVGVSTAARQTKREDDGAAMERTLLLAMLLLTVPFLVTGQQTAGSDAAAIETWLKGYDAAFMAKDLEKLATFYHPDVTIYEGGGINDGWVDYRDRHLGARTEGVRKPAVWSQEYACVDIAWWPT